MIADEGAVFSQLRAWARAAQLVALILFALCVSTNFCAAKEPDCAYWSGLSDAEIDANIAACPAKLKKDEAYMDLDPHYLPRDYRERADLYLHRAVNAQNRANGDAALERAASQDLHQAIADTTKCLQLMDAVPVKTKRSPTGENVKTDYMISSCYNKRGAAHARLQEYDLMIADLKKALEARSDDDDDPDVYAIYNNDLVHAYMLIAREAMGAGDCRRAIAAEDDAIRANENPKAADQKSNTDFLYIRKGMCYEKLEEPDKAAAQYDELIRADASDVEAYFLRGRLRLAQGEAERAVSDLSAAIALAPDVPEYRVVRGKGFLMLGDAGDAIADLDSAIMYAPDAETYMLRGQAKRGNGDLAGALADFNEAIKRDGNLAPAYFNRAFIKAAQRDLDGALADLDAAIRFDPKSPTYFTMRGIVWGMNGNLDKAVAEYGAAIALDPQNAERYATRAWALFKSGRLPDGLSDANRALALQPKLADAFVARGHIEEAMMQRDKAVADFRAALANSTGLADAEISLKRLSAGR